MIASYTDISGCTCWIDATRGITFNSTTGQISAIVDQSPSPVTLTLAGNLFYHPSPKGIYFPTNINAVLGAINSSTYGLIKFPTGFLCDSANSTVMAVIAPLNGVGDQVGCLFPVFSSTAGNGENLWLGDQGRLTVFNSTEGFFRRAPVNTHCIGHGPMIIAKSKRGGTLKMYVDGVEFNTAANTPQVGQSSTPSFQVGGLGTGFTTHSLMAVLHELVIWNKNLSTQEIADATELARIRWNRSTHPSIVYAIEGDSIAFGASSQYWLAGVVDPYQCWPTQVALKRNIRLVNWGFPGTQISAYGTGGIGNVGITNGGTGYSGAPTVAFTVGSGVVATATVSNGQVTGISVSNQGNGHYTYTPPIAITGGGGSGCIAKATVVNGLVTGITVIDPGKNYTTAPTVTAHVSAGTGAAGTAVLTGNAVTSVTMTNNGSAYDVLPDVTFSGGSGTGAAGIAGFFLVAGTINNGTGYTSATVQVINQSGDTGTGMTVTATVSGDTSISGITVTNFGYGYRKMPSLKIVGNGTGARFAVHMGTNGSSQSLMLFSVPESVPGVAILQRATNDMGTSYSGLQTFMSARNWAWAMRAAGYKYVLAQDCLPRGGASPISATNLSQYNQLLAQYKKPGNDGTFDGIIQVSTHVLAQNTADTAANAASGGNMFQDSLHPTSILNGILAQCWNDDLAAFSSNVSSSGNTGNIGRWW